MRCDSGGFTDEWAQFGDIDVQGPAPLHALHGVPVHVCAACDYVLCAELTRGYDSSQLCTDLEEYIKAHYLAQILAVFIPTLGASEPMCVLPPSLPCPLSIILYLLPTSPQRLYLPR